MKAWFAIGMLSVAGVIVLFVMGSPEFGARPLLPGLVPYVGWPFALVFLAAQVAFCLAFGARGGLLWIVAVWVVLVPMVYVGTPFRWSENALSGIDRALTVAACGSALVLGFSALREP